MAANKYSQFAGGTHSRNDRASAASKTFLSQGPWTDLPQLNRARVWRAVLVLREREGTVQNSPFQTCTSEEGCRNQVTGSPVSHSLSLSLHLCHTVCRSGYCVNWIASFSFTCCFTEASRMDISILRSLFN